MFPPAIRYKLNPDGSIGTEAEEPIAADARPQGDGKNAALVKITAGLLGVRLDEIIRRAERARARHRRIVGAIAGTFLFLLVGASGALAYGYYKSLENDSLMDDVVRVRLGFVSDATDMSSKLGIPTAVPLALLTRADGALNRYIGKGTDSPKLRYRRAQLQLEIADNYAKLGQTPQRMQRVQEARSILEKLVADGEPDGRIRDSLATAPTQVADVMLAQGASPAQVLAEIPQGARHPRKPAGTKSGPPGHSVPAHHRLRTYRRPVAQPNDLTEAAKIVEELVALREQLAKAAPDDPYARQNPAIAYDRAAHVAYDRGLIDEAIAGYRKALAIAQALVAAAPNDTAFLRDLATVHGALAQTLSATSDIEGATVEAKASLAIRKRLADSDPSNAIWQNDLAGSYETLGNLHWVKSELSDALTNYRAAYTIKQKLAAADPTNVDTNRSLSVARGRVARALGALGNTDEALELHRENAAVREKIAAASPTDVQRKLDLAQAYWAIGDLLVVRKAHDEALSYYEKGRAITGNRRRRRPQQRDAATSASRISISRSAAPIRPVARSKARLKPCASARRSARSWWPPIPCSARWLSITCLCCEVSLHSKTRRKSSWRTRRTAATIPGRRSASGRPHDRPCPGLCESRRPAPGARRAAARHRGLPGRDRGDRRADRQKSARAEPLVQPRDRPPVLARDGRRQPEAGRGGYRDVAAARRRRRADKEQKTSSAARKLNSRNSNPRTWRRDERASGWP